MSKIPIFHAYDNGPVFLVTDSKIPTRSEEAHCAMIFLQLIYTASDASPIEIWEKNITNDSYFSINFEK